VAISSSPLRFEITITTRNRRSWLLTAYRPFLSFRSAEPPKLITVRRETPHSVAVFDSEPPVDLIVEAVFATPIKVSRVRSGNAKNSSTVLAMTRFCVRDRRRFVFV
jgi:hypothetical protein